MLRECALRIPYLGHVYGTQLYLVTCTYNQTALHQVTQQLSGFSVRTSVSRQDTVVCLTNVSLDRGARPLALGGVLDGFDFLATFWGDFLGYECQFVEDL